MNTLLRAKRVATAVFKSDPGSRKIAIGGVVCLVIGIGLLLFSLPNEEISAMMED